MAPKRPNKGQAIGADAEEALRSYFWRAGFFAIRGVPVQIDGEDITDLDIWLYERPSGVARGTQFVDIKYKAKPRAFERILWSLGVSEALAFDGVFVATPDTRPTVRGFAQTVGVELIDGHDLSRIVEAYRKSDWSALYISEEELVFSLAKIDGERKQKTLQDSFSLVKAVYSIRPSAHTLVRLLGLQAATARMAAEQFPSSAAAEATTRLTYFASAMVAVNLDSIISEAYFRSNQEKIEYVASAIRFGNSDQREGLRPLRTAVALIEKYTPDSNVNRIVSQGYQRDLASIPAEIVAEAALHAHRNSNLFDLAREYCEAAYKRQLPSFDDLSAPAKGLLGALLDFGRLKREEFASRWSAGSASPREQDGSTPKEKPSTGSAVEPVLPLDDVKPASDT